MATSRMCWLTAMLLLAALNVLVVVRYHMSDNPTTETFSWTGHDFPERLPLPRNLDTVLLTVEESAHFQLGADAEMIWRSPSMAAPAYCRLGPRHRLFTITMFHELHCLRILNRGFAGAAHVAHVAHCLSYLRHGALCGADLTLERGDFARRNFSRDRAGAMHECRDWSLLYDVMADNWTRWSAVRQEVLAQ